MEVSYPSNSSMWFLKTLFFVLIYIYIYLSYMLIEEEGGRWGVEGSGGEREWMRGVKGGGPEKGVCGCGDAIACGNFWPNFVQ